MRQEVREQRHVTGSVKLDATEGGLSSRLVVETKNLSKAYDGKPVVPFGQAAQPADDGGTVDIPASRP